VQDASQCFILRNRSRLGRVLSGPGCSHETRTRGVSGHFFQKRVNPRQKGGEETVQMLESHNEWEIFSGDSGSGIHIVSFY